MIFNASRTYAFVMSPRLGDSLLSMIIVHNLVRYGYRVTVFGTQIDALRDWFPGVDIHASPTSADAAATLAAFDVVLHAYHADTLLDAEHAHPGSVVMDDWAVYRQVKNMVDIQMEICQRHFGIDSPVRSNGMSTPGALPQRADMRRVIIHPMASDRQKSWRPMRFVKLALRLRNRGFEPEFLLPPSALAEWQWLTRYGFTPCAYRNLSAVAAHIATSGWVIGNDSGIGHLASNLGIPTVSLAMRPSIAQRWKPGWAPSRTVVAPGLVPSRFLKEHCWKYLLSTARVMTAFDALRRDCGAPQRSQDRIGSDLNTAESVIDIRHAG